MSKVLHISPATISRKQKENTFLSSFPIRSIKISMRNPFMKCMKKEEPSVSGWRRCSAPPAIRPTDDGRDFNLKIIIFLEAAKHLLSSVYIPVQSFIAPIYDHFALRSFPPFLLYSFCLHWIFCLRWLRTLHLTQLNSIVYKKHCRYFRIS